MPVPKKFTDEELRARKNARSRQRYLEIKDREAARIKAWREKFPDDFAKVVGDVAAKEIAQLTENLSFERRLNRREV